MPSNSSEQGIVSAVTREFKTTPIKSTRDAVAVGAALLGAFVLIVTHADTSLKIAGACFILLSAFFSFMKPTYRMLRGSQYASKDLGIIVFAAIGIATIMPGMGLAWVLQQSVKLQETSIAVWNAQNQVTTKMISEIASITADGLEGADNAKESSILRLKQLANIAAPSKDSLSGKSQGLQVADRALIYAALVMHISAVCTLAACAYSLSVRCARNELGPIPLHKE